MFSNWIWSIFEKIGFSWFKCVSVSDPRLELSGFNFDNIKHPFSFISIYFDNIKHPFSLFNFISTFFHFILTTLSTLLVCLLRAQCCIVLNWPPRLNNEQTFASWILTIKQAFKVFHPQKHNKLFSIIALLSTKFLFHTQHASRCFLLTSKVQWSSTLAWVHLREWWSSIRKSDQCLSVWTMAALGTWPDQIPISLVNQRIESESENNKKSDQSTLIIQTKSNTHQSCQTLQECETLNSESDQCVSLNDKKTSSPANIYSTSYISISKF